MSCDPVRLWPTVLALHVDKHSATIGRSIVVLVNADPLDTLGIVGFSSIPFRSPLLGALHLCFRLLPEPRRPATGDPRTPPSARDSAALREATETHPGRSTPVGRALRGLERWAVQSLPRPTRDGDRLASERLSLILDLENSTARLRPIISKIRSGAGVCSIPLGGPAFVVMV
jgi:hypothetical protein